MPTPPLVITLWETHGSSLDAVAARVGEILAVPVHGDALFEELGEIDTAELARRNTESVTAAAEEGGIILGRNAAFILRDRPSTLHVKLEGIVARRAEQATGRQGLPWDPRDIEAYDAILNTAAQDGEETAQFIAALARATT